MQKDQESLVVRREIDRVNVGGPTLQKRGMLLEKHLRTLIKKRRT